MALTLETALPENRRIFSEQFTIAEAGKEAAKAIKFASLEYDALIESIFIEAYDAVMIPDPLNPGQFIAEQTKAITKERIDRDRILVTLERVNNESFIISTGTQNTRAIDMFAFNEMFKIGRNPGWTFPKGTELSSRIRHEYNGQKPACGLPIVGSVTISLFYDK